MARLYLMYPNLIFHHQHGIVPKKNLLPAPRDIGDNYHLYWHVLVGSISPCEG